MLQPASKFVTCFSSRAPPGPESFGLTSSSSLLLAADEWRCHACSILSKINVTVRRDGDLTLVSGAGEGEVVSKEVGEEERGAQG